MAFTSVRCCYVRSVRPNKYRVEYYENQHSNTGTAAELQDVLDMARSLLRDIRVAEDESDNSECELPVAKLTQLKTVLEMYGGFKGINRKVQLKPKKWSFEKDKNGIPRRVATEVLLVLSLIHI